MVGNNEMMAMVDETRCICDVCPIKGECPKLEKIKQYFDAHGPEKDAPSPEGDLSPGDKSPCYGTMNKLGKKAIEHCYAECDDVEECAKASEPGPLRLSEDYPEDCDDRFKKKCYDVRNDCPHGTETAYQHCPLLGDCPYTKGDV